MDASRIVPQRTPYDCLPAALATVMGWTYERARDVLGSHTDEGGTHILPLAATLLRHGVASTYLVAREHPCVEGPGARISKLPSAAEIRRLLPGRRAILTTRPTNQAEGPYQGIGHAVAWDGEAVIDCGSTLTGRPSRTLPLSDQPLWEVLLLGPENPLPQSGERQSATQDFAALCERHERIILAFSGGKESVVLAHMLEPWRERVTLAWVRVEHVAPHMVEFVRGYADRGWRLEEISSPSLAQRWQAFGPPADVFSLQSLEGRSERRFQTYHACCHALRQEPLNAFVRAQERPCCFIHGQRTADLGATVAGLRHQLPASVEIGMPLADWSEADVLAYIEQHGLVLPAQYAEGLRNSLECLVCPSEFTTARASYLRRHYPYAVPIVQGAIRDACTEALNATMDLYALTVEAPRDR